MHNIIVTIFVLKSSDHVAKSLGELTFGRNDHCLFLVP